ncbi:hypothetical protein [Streptomyces sp. 15-116A]|uniref:hypothetical protein n=1 Tax=Streptomyces sp. 15-116A TaxID=2259035 RepID=UPI0037D9C0DD
MSVGRAQYVSRLLRGGWAGGCGGASGFGVESLSTSLPMSTWIWRMRATTPRSSSEKP